MVIILIYLLQKKKNKSKSEKKLPCELFLKFFDHALRSVNDFSFFKRASSRMVHIYFAQFFCSPKFYRRLRD